MEDGLKTVLVLAYSYLVGAVPTAYLVGRLTRGIDIRRYGSGNVGTSNVARHLGRRWSVAVAAFDSGVKGLATVAIARSVGLDLGYQALAALLAMAGHNWSAYIKLSGGRGLAVTIGALVLLSWKLVLALLGVALIGWLVFRSIGLWFAIAIVLLPGWALAFGEPPVIVWYCGGVIALTALKRALSNPGTSRERRRWRESVVPRLLFDRDTWRRSDWVNRTPEESEAKE